MTADQARSAARTIAGRDAIAGVARDRDDFLCELRTYATRSGWPTIKRRTNARAYGHYLAFLEEFQPRRAGDSIVACSDCTLPVSLTDGDAGPEGNDGVRVDDAWVHEDCAKARCTDCGEIRGVACAHRRAEAA